MDSILLLMIFLALCGVSSLLLLLLRKTSRITYLGSVAQFNPQADVTTTIPMSIHAASCDHDWETVTEQCLEMPHEKKLVLVLKCMKCGCIDKTCQVTSIAPKPPPPPPPPPQPPQPRSECRHRWTKEKSVMLDSAYEQMLKSISYKTQTGRLKVNDDKKLDLELNEAPAWMFKKTYVAVRVCDLCGEIDKIVTSNFEGEDPPVEEEVENDGE